MVHRNHRNWNKDNEIDEQKCWILNIINEQFGLFSIFLNHSINGEEFFHWWTCIYDVIFLLIQSRIFLLILPISDLDGLISLNEGLCGKFSLWSLTVICASWFCHWSTLSLINSLSPILFASSSTLLTFELVYFLYVLVILSLNYFLYSSLSISVNYEFFMLEQWFCSYTFIWCLFPVVLWHYEIQWF